MKKAKKKEKKKLKKQKRIAESLEGQQEKVNVDWCFSVLLIILDTQTKL